MHASVNRAARPQTHTPQCSLLPTRKTTPCSPASVQPRVHHSTRPAPPGAADSSPRLPTPAMCPTPCALARRHQTAGLSCERLARPVRRRPSSSMTRSCSSAAATGMPLRTCSGQACVQGQPSGVHGQDRGACQLNRALLRCRRAASHSMPMPAHRTRRTAYLQSLLDRVLLFLSGLQGEGQVRAAQAQGREAPAGGGSASAAAACCSAGEASRQVTCALMQQLRCSHAQGRRPRVTAPQAPAGCRSGRRMNTP